MAIALAETLKENSALAELDLSYNELGEAGGLYLAAGLVSDIFHTIKSLFLFSNDKWAEVYFVLLA